MIRMKKELVAVGVFAVTATVQANLLVETFTDNNLNSHTHSLTDTGWGAKTFWKSGPNAGELETQYLNWANAARSFGVAQTISVGSTTGAKLKFSFDWTPSATASNSASRILTYQLFGWDTGGVAPDSTDGLALGMNFFGTTIGTDGSGLPEGAVAYDFINGTWGSDADESGGLFLHPTTRVGYPGSPSVSTNFGETISFSGEFDVTLNGQSDLADYDYIGVRFIVGDSDNNIGTNDADSNGGAVISNISLEAIPEPASIALIAAFGGSILFIRRLF